MKILFIGLNCEQNGPLIENCKNMLRDAHLWWDATGSFECHSLHEARDSDLGDRLHEFDLVIAGPQKEGQTVSNADILGKKFTDKLAFSGLPILVLYEGAAYERDYGLPGSSPSYSLFHVKGGVIDFPVELMSMTREKIVTRIEGGRGGKRHSGVVLQLFPSRSGSAVRQYTGGKQGVPNL
ncbi:MAG: hypothetical protein KGI97_00495 [Alphaproteobacteria bacterium]|nr:hypothetical protein [Alphaproteobacteria bacterium]